jgi:hypothetical protein
MDILLHRFSFYTSFIALCYTAKTLNEREREREQKYFQAVLLDFSKSIA